jgi:hypothetical protein
MQRANKTSKLQICNSLVNRHSTDSGAAQQLLLYVAGANKKMKTKTNVKAGAVMVEYGLLLALIAVVCIGAR